MRATIAAKSAVIEVVEVVMAATLETTSDSHPIPKAQYQHELSGFEPSLAVTVSDAPGGVADQGQAESVTGALRWRSGSRKM